MLVYLIRVRQVSFGDIEGNRYDFAKCSNIYYRSDPAYGFTNNKEIIGPTQVKAGGWSTLASRISSAFKDKMNAVEGLDEKTPGLAWEEKITNED